MTRILSLAWLFALGMTSGCATFHQTDRLARLENGLTIVLPGVEGEGILSHQVASGLESGGAQGAIETFEWTTGKPIQSIQHLTDHESSQRSADRLSEKIMAYRDTYPGRPLHLVGHSGGAAVMLMAVQRLPDSYDVDRIVLLAPAISPRFAIDDVLAKASLVYLFRSPFDVQLTLGTSVFGTVDRDFRPAAGSYGFQHAADPARLVDIPFHPSMTRDGNLGGHLGVTNKKFVERWVAPLLRQSAPDQ